MNKWTIEELEKYNNFVQNYLKSYQDMANFYFEQLLKWTWHGQEIHGAYVYYITKDMGNDPPVMFVGLQAGSSARLWTRNKNQVATFLSDSDARKFIEKTFSKKEQSKLLIVRED